MACLKFEKNSESFGIDIYKGGKRLLEHEKGDKNKGSLEKVIKSFVHREKGKMNKHRWNHIQK